MSNKIQILNNSILKFSKNTRQLLASNSRSLLKFKQSTKTQMKKSRKMNNKNKPYINRWQKYNKKWNSTGFYKHKIIS